MYSSSVSPFQAKTGVPVAAIAAAAWSWVEKMLHDDQVTYTSGASKSGSSENKEQQQDQSEQR
jgi:hypothetical protein